MMDWAAAIRAVAEAVSDVCNVLQTPEGQQWMKATREQNAAALQQLEAVGKWFAGLIEGAKK